VVLPALFYAMSHLREPRRTWIVTIAYLLAAAWMPIVFALRFNPLAIVTIGGALLGALALYSPVWRKLKDA
jgi:tryptophan-rich sensory protein